MKKYAVRMPLLTLLLLLGAMSAPSFAARLQVKKAGVVVAPKKVVYRRVIKGLPAGKRTFTVIYPIISGAPQARKIQNLVSYEKLFEFNLQEAIREDDWLAEASYAVNYNRNGLLDMTLIYSGSAAYPDTAVKTIVVNVANGERVTPTDAFVKSAALAAKIKRAQQAEIKKAVVSIKKENPDEADPASLFTNSDFQEADLAEFSVSDKGITFIYDYGFPHVIAALQPEGRYFYSWQAMKPFLKVGGSLAVFNR